MVGDIAAHSLMPPGSSLSVHAKLQMSTSWPCVCVKEGGVIIKHDLTDDRVLLLLYVQACVLCVLYLLYCPNGQLPLLITVNFTIHVSSFPFPSLMGVCMYVCTFTYVYTDVIDAIYLTPPQHPLRFSGPKLPLAVAPLSTVSIKQAIYFMTPVLQTFSRFTVIFMY